LEYPRARAVTGGRKQHSARAPDSLSKTASTARKKTRCGGFFRSSFLDEEKKEAARGGFQGSHQT
jgi:hypothetical protein